MQIPFFTLFGTLASVSISILLHALLYRVLLSIGLKPVRTLVVFVVTFVAFFVWIVSLLPQDIAVHRISAVVLYTLCIVNYLLLISSPLLGDESPSLRIVRMVRTHGRVSRRTIIGEFTDAQLIDKRLRELVSTGFIEKKGVRYIVKPKGVAFMRLVQRYRTFFGWDQSG